MSRGRRESGEIFPFHPAAVIAAHCSKQTPGFRQRDVRFFIELFSNWMECTVGARTLTVQNTQAARYIDVLARDGWISTRRSGKPPVYLLRAAGLVELAERLAARPYFLPFEHAYFVVFFLRCYGSVVRERAAADAISAALARRLDRLLDSSAVIERQRAFLTSELAKIAERSAAAEGAALAGNEWVRSGIPLAQVVERISREYPYDLNAQEPLAPILRAMPESLRRWEVTEAPSARVELLWKPLRTILEGHVSMLDALSRPGK